MFEHKREHIAVLTAELEETIQRNPLLNIDTFIIPSPYISETRIERDYEHSYVWIEEGEILGYILVYSDEQKANFHIYKIVTSPFGRGRGIGKSFIEHLAAHIPSEAALYLYVWEKQIDTLEYFQYNGFTVQNLAVYRNRRYLHLIAHPQDILNRANAEKAKIHVKVEDISKTRHDARKTIRLLSHLVDSLTIGNAGRTIEDINRETTTLINMLNVFRDTVDRIHEVNLQDIILERIVPYVQGSSVPCRLRLSFDSNTHAVLGYYVNVGRALINITANSLDAIKESGRNGCLEISLVEEGDIIQLILQDNGIGISRTSLELDEQGIPAFVGKTTKGRDLGEGLGTVQVFETFGADAILVESEEGEWTRWTISFKQPEERVERWYSQLERRFLEFENLLELYNITSDSPRTDIIAYIWQLRKMEIFLFDVIFHFSKYHNIRTIYRTILSFMMGGLSAEELGAEIDALRSEYPEMQHWLYEITQKIHHLQHNLRLSVPMRDFQGPSFRSYGQALDNIIIFTLDPETGDFFATDRKLAEHLDFVPYLGGVRDVLLRGEMIGDINTHNQPITLGVWSVTSHEDLVNKLKLIQKGAKRLLNMGVHKEKRLNFYQVTYVLHDEDIDTDSVTTFGDFVQLDTEGLKKCIRSADSEVQAFFSMQD